MSRSNPIGLPDEYTEQSLPVLDVHVSSMFVLFHQYQKHHWLVFGPQFRDLHLYLEEAYTQIHEDLDALAERMTVLGGIPTSSPSRQIELSLFKHEDEGEKPVREMLKADLKAEQLVLRHLRDTIAMVSENGDFGTEKLLKGILYNSEDRAHHLEHYLEKNTLPPASA
ncbi:MAG: DNA starvation/stationary phase protection protein [Bacteroidetes bacterium]|nr:DNA starvation/stationary phase protection protein [Bacteroidota bacterium]